MRLFPIRRTQPTPAAPDPAAVAAGLRTFAEDLEAGDLFALDCIGKGGELPFTPAEWAAYPTCIVRRARIAYLGKPGPGDIPDADFDRLCTELAATR